MMKRKQKILKDACAMHVPATLYREGRPSGVHFRFVRIRDYPFAYIRTQLEPETSRPPIGPGRPIEVSFNIEGARFQFSSKTIGCLGGRFYFLTPDRVDRVERRAQSRISGDQARTYTCSISGWRNFVMSAPETEDVEWHHRVFIKDLGENGIGLDVSHVNKTFLPRVGSKWSDATITSPTGRVLNCSLSVRHIEIHEQVTTGDAIRVAAIGFSFEDIADHDLQSRTLWLDEIRSYTMSATQLADGQ